MPHRSPSIPPTHLREIVEAALDIPILGTPAGRDAVLTLLRPEVSSAVPRLPTARMDTMSIVATCVRYPGALSEFLEAIRFYADGTIAMSHLDAVIATHLPTRPQPCTKVDKSIID